MKKLLGKKRKRLNEKRVLITGTTQGIGHAIIQLLKEQYYVIGINRRSDEHVDENIICDLSNIEEVQKVVEKIKEKKIEILINNAGGSVPCKFLKLSMNSIIYDINLNFVTPMLLMQAVIPNMICNGYGKIVNISSISAKAPTPYLHTYSAAKRALDSLTISCAKEYGDKNITINSICPGAVETIMSVEGRKKISYYKDMEQSDYQEGMIKGTGLGRMVNAKEVAMLVEFLISDKAEAISGQTINICGTLETN